VGRLRPTPRGMDMNGTTRATLEALRQDAVRYREVGGRRVTDIGMLVGATYRLGAWARTLPAVPRVPVTVAYLALHAMWRTVLNVNISAKARIGPGLCLMHPRNVLIAPTEIGDNFMIFHEVTIGSNGLPARYPKIGSDVSVFVGARVLGGINVGQGAKIGANCVVTDSVAAGCAVVPAPNRVVSPALVGAFARNGLRAAAKG
jgi:serine acetyltransferase